MTNDDRADSQESVPTARVGTSRQQNFVPSLQGLLTSISILECVVAETYSCLSAAGNLTQEQVGEIARLLQTYSSATQGQNQASDAVSYVREAKENRFDSISALIILTENHNRPDFLSDSNRQSSPRHVIRRH